jgi:peroxiredoxin
MSLRTGDRAEGFSLPCAPGEMVDVAAAIGSGPVVLLFFPLSYSPVCTDEFCQMRDDWSKWESLSATVFGISVDSPFVTSKFAAELNLPFPLLSDFNATVCTAWDVCHDDLMGLHNVAKRSAFVISPEGSIVYDWYTDDPSVQVPFDEVVAACQAAAIC